MQEPPLLQGNLTLKGVWIMDFRDLVLMARTGDREAEGQFLSEVNNLVKRASRRAYWNGFKDPAVGQEDLFQEAVLRVINILRNNDKDIDDISKRYIEATAYKVAYYYLRDTFTKHRIKQPRSQTPVAVQSLDSMAQDHFFEPADPCGGGIKDSEYRISKEQFLEFEKNARKRSESVIESVTFLLSRYESEGCGRSSVKPIPGKVKTHRHRYLKDDIIDFFKLPDDQNPGSPPGF